MFKIILIYSLICLDYSNCINLCGDWIQYNDIKCIKVLEKKGTEEEAIKNCTQLHQSSTLLTIHSKEEQEYLNNLLGKYHNISLSAWIGMKYNQSGFKWIDGTESNYTNWSDDAVKDGSTQCVEMSLIKENIGKWSDESCKKSALIVCQKKQELSLSTIMNELDNLTKVIEKQEKEINEFKASTIQAIFPIGYLYTQLPNQTSPLDLWPNLKWIEVTKEYSGLFFRAEGGDSESFGRIQPANQSWISDVASFGCKFSSWNGTTKCDDWQYISLDPNAWTYAGFTNALYNLQFYKTGGETRPKNTAIRIFKRIK